MVMRTRNNNRNNNDNGRTITIELTITKGSLCHTKIPPPPQLCKLPTSQENCKRETYMDEAIILPSHYSMKNTLLLKKLHAFV
jgi:hypothetical protein